MFRAFNLSKARFLTAAGITSTLVSYNAIQTYNPVFLENLKQVVVDKSVDPFPTSIGNFHLLGHGVRSVTFVGFKVYAIGLYLRDSDRKSITEILTPEQIENLEDAEKSTELISQVWEKAEMKIRICPVRNTDFSHLKDGFIKLILANPMLKQNTQISEGLDEIREIFKKFRGSVPKNHVMMLETDHGKLSFSYENTSTGEIKHLGTVNEPLISKCLIVSYLSSRKPLSEPLRKSCIEGFKFLK